MVSRERTDIPPNVALTRLDEIVAWGRKYSLWPMPFGTACCAIEFMGVVSSEYDLSRFGAELVRFSPRQSDMMLVMGTVTYKMAPVLQRIYNQMCEPKWVVSVGACASCGGFYDNYHVLQGIDQVVPVDVYVAGCPPRPENILDAVVKLQEKLMREPRVPPSHERHGEIRSAETFNFVAPPIPAPNAGGNTRMSLDGPDTQVGTLVRGSIQVGLPEPARDRQEPLLTAWSFPA